MSGIDDVVSITLDAASNKLYWAQTFGDRLVRGDLSSTDIETLLTFPLLDDPISLAFDPTVVKPIPAASTWGLVAFVLSLLTTGTLVLAKRRSPRVEYVWLSTAPRTGFALETTPPGQYNDTGE